MASKSETVFKERVLKQLSQIPNSWWEKIQQIGKRGTPDILGCVRGRFVGMELKATAKGKLTPLQIYKLIKIHDAGGLAYSVHPENFEEIYLELLDL